MTNLKSVAAEAGVSVMAVSKALRDASDISVGTKERIRKIAEQLGYVPNGNARGLRNRKSNAIGVVLPRLDQGFFAQILSGILKSASETGHQIFICQTDDNLALELKELRTLLERQVEGILLAPALRMGGRLEFLEMVTQRNIPVVFLDRFPANATQFPRTGFVVAQDRLGASIATEYLIAQGHRDILHLAGPLGASSTEERLMGYRKALEKSKVGYRDSLVFRAGSDIEEGRKAMMQVLSEKVSFSAIFAVNDYVAVGACEILLSQGIKIPEEVSVVGFGDVRLAKYYQVPLTTIYQGQKELGRLSFGMLLQMIQGIEVEPRLLPVQLVERKSVAKVLS
ncbi:MAG: LacI family DNA-binding transcriptional regulator [Verrucomicrobiia bacterium]